MSPSSPLPTYLAKPTQPGGRGLGGWTQDEVEQRWPHLGHPRSQAPWAAVATGRRGTVSSLTSTPGANQDLEREASPRSATKTRARLVGFTIEYFGSDPTIVIPMCVVHPRPIDCQIKLSREQTHLFLLLQCNGVLKNNPQRWTLLWIQFLNVEDLLFNTNWHV